MTPQTLANAVGCPLALAITYAPHLEEGCEAYGINTPARLAAFLAQLGHESGGFRYVREVWGPTPAQLTYEGRKNLGNTEPGDGAKYKGHGLIQITGRYNHATTRDRLREKFGPAVPDFEATPELLEQPRWAALSACDFWDSRHLNQLADNGDFEMITRRVNGGTNGQADRLVRWERAKRALYAQSHPGAAMPTPISLPINPTPPEEANTVTPFIAAALPSLFDLVPKLLGLFKGEDPTADRNIKVAELLVTTAKGAVQASNEQDLIEKIKADPAAAAAVKVAIESKWLELSEAGGGGIEGARMADAAISGNELLKSPSFWVALLLLPMVYMIVASLIGLIGTATWSDDVRAGLAGSIISAVIGGLVGYYYGQTTSRNRPPS